MVIVDGTELISFHNILHVRDSYCVKIAKSFEALLYAWTIYKTSLISYFLIFDNHTVIFKHSFVVNNLIYELKS